jgi:hypothetical protein
MLTETEGEALARDFASRFIETSAKSAIQVDKAFHDLGREITRCKNVYSIPELLKPGGGATMAGHRRDRKQDVRRGGCVAM